MTKIDASQARIIARKIKEHRKKRRFTQVDLGALVGLSNTYIAHIESGRIPSLEYAFRIESILEMRQGEITRMIIEAEEKSAKAYLKNQARVVVRKA